MKYQGPKNLVDPNVTSLNLKVVLLFTCVTTKIQHSACLLFLTCLIHTLESNNFVMWFEILNNSFIHEDIPNE